MYFSQHWRGFSFSFSLSELNLTLQKSGNPNLRITSNLSSWNCWNGNASDFLVCYYQTKKLMGRRHGWELPFHTFQVPSILHSSSSSSSFKFRYSFFHLLTFSFTFPLPLSHFTHYFHLFHNLNFALCFTFWMNVLFNSINQLLTFHSSLWWI